MPELLQFQRRFAEDMQVVADRPTPMLVYRNTSLLGAIEALRDNFPVTCDIVGERVFEVLVTSFARRYPPENPVLARYGRKFAEWLSAQDIADAIPYLADVARCERMWVESLHSPDSPALELGDLPQGDADQLLLMRPRIHPAARFEWQSTPAIEIWRVHQDGFEGVLEPEWRACGALFTRPEFNADGIAIDAACHRILFGIRIGETLGEAARAAITIYPAADVGNCFAELVQAGAFAAISSERTSQ